MRRRSRNADSFVRANEKMQLIEIWNWRMYFLTASCVVRLLCTPKKSPLRKQCSSVSTYVHGNVAGRSEGSFRRASKVPVKIYVDDRKFHIQTDKGEEATKAAR